MERLKYFSPSSNVELTACMIVSHILIIFDVAIEWLSFNR